jgi:hypothetical protein
MVIGPVAVNMAAGAVPAGRPVPGSQWPDIFGTSAMKTISIVPWPFASRNTPLLSAPATE